ncbi:MAG: DHH family phosphoesterase, partial [Patescibacteria group bacterium]
MKNWRLRPNLPDEHDLATVFSCLIAQLLYNRKIEKATEADIFFNPSFDKLHDPFLFNDMRKSCERIWTAILKKEKILIHGDYDADGVTSSAILAKTLKIFGADFSVFIPHRELDGYGLNLRNIENFIFSGTKLVITVDCGITNVDEVQKLKEHGVETVITDHHEPPEILPEALAIIDPKVVGENYPCKFLSGAGVAYKLAVALLRSAPAEMYEMSFVEYGGMVGFEKWLLDIVAIGTVADMVPLLEENRILTKWGLLVLSKTRNLGLQKLLEKVSVSKFDTFTIGFQLAPRLNAAGRMKHAEAAYRLLITEDIDEATALA